MTDDICFNDFHCSNRAKRRAAYLKKKKEAKERLKRWAVKPTGKMVGLHANTPKPCSCHMCMNPRRSKARWSGNKWDKLTRQEQLAEIKLQEQIEEYGL